MRSLIIKTALFLMFSSSSMVLAEELKTPDPTNAGAAGLPPSIDVAPVDSQSVAPKTEPVVPAAAPAEAPKPSVDLKQFKELDDRVADLARKNYLLKVDIDEQKKTVALLEGRLSVLEDDSRYKSIAVGFGLSFKTDSGSAVAFKIQGNLGGFTGFYYAGMGGGMAWSMVVHVKRVRISPFGFGLMIYQDPENAFTSRWLERSVDMVLPIGVDVRVWKGVTVGAQIVWFIPNPVDVASASKNSGKSSANNANPTSGTSFLTGVPDKALNDSGDVVSRAFGDAFKSPRLELDFKWSFE